VLFGRGRELEDCERLLGAAEHGRGGLRTVKGAPGIGKTRLADEVAARAVSRGFRVAWGRAWETGGAPAYFPWIEILDGISDLEPELVPRTRALLESGTRISLGDGARADPARERFGLFEAVSQCLRGASRRAPLFLSFDDLHASDVASLELLSFVARGLRASRIAVLGTFRDWEGSLPHVAEALSRIGREGEMTSLRALTREEVAEWVRYEIGHFDVALSATFYDLTQGNPLFLREVLQAVGTDPRTAGLEALRDAAALGGVLAVVQSRLAGMGDDPRACLGAASVLGREVSLALLCEAAPLDPDAARRALEEATRRGFLSIAGEDRWVFSHVLVREAFYQQLAPDLRRDVHRRVAESLGRRIEAGHDELLSPLAHHALSAVPAYDSRQAVLAARRAADHARAQLAYEEAVSLLERALSVCDLFGLDDGVRAEVLLSLGWAATESGKLSRGRELFRRASDLARRTGDVRLLARAALGQGGEYVLAEIRSELVDVLREALLALDGGGSVEERRLRARLLARLAAALTPSATPEEPLALARQALGATREEPDPRTRIDVDVGVGAALMDFAPPLDRIPVNERLRRNAREAGDRVLELRALTRLACDHLERGDAASADAAILAREELARSIGHPRYLWQSPLLASMRDMALGRFEDCEVRILEARRIASEAAVEGPDPNAERCIEIHRFSLLLFAGRSDALRAQQAPTLRVLGSLPDQSMLCNWVSGVVAARLGDRARAVDCLRALGTGHVMTARMSRGLIADAAVEARAPMMYGPLYGTFDPKDDSNLCWGPFGFACGPPIARLLSAIAFAEGRTAAALSHAELALLVVDRMDAKAHRAWVHLTMGEGLASGDAARSHLESALELGESLAMPEVVARARAAFERAPSAGAARPSGVPVPSFTLERTGDQWTVTHAGRSFRLKNVRGLGMLARLVEHPDREFYALDLAADPAGPGEAADRGDAGEILDQQAIAAYRQRISDLRAHLEEASAFSDGARASALRAELEALEEQIAAAVGLGGRSRRAGSAAERARIVVQRRVREAIRKIAEQDPELGRHLDVSIRTGMFAAYEPRGRGTAP
jgi:tetratricopeptide (TPR) repeat protein